jgi:NAD(P)-dependent dehydrogenase (short-subunit alcohol dehydrogenase family)
VSAIRLDGQVAIVTGAGRGLGRAYAIELARRGAKVVVNDDAGRHEPTRRPGEMRADDVAQEITATGGGAVANYEDVATPGGARAVVEDAVSRWGTVDIVISNAGFLRTGYFEDLTEDQIEQVLSVHLRAAFYLIQPAWRIVKEKGYGRILVASSSSGAFGHQGLANYAAAKAGLIGLTRALAYEAREYGDIRVNALLPQAKTEISATDPIPMLFEEFARHVPEGGGELMGSRGDPDGVMPMAVYLCSPACQVSGEAYAARMGSYARVFIGIAQGWTAPEAPGATVDDIAKHFDQIRDLDARFTVPTSLYDEVADVVRVLLAHST